MSQYNNSLIEYHYDNNIQYNYQINDEPLYNKDIDYLYNNTLSNTYNYFVSQQNGLYIHNFAIFPYLNHPWGWFNTNNISKFG